MLHLDRRLTTTTDCRKTWPRVQCSAAQCSAVQWLCRKVTEKSRDQGVNPLTAAVWPAAALQHQFRP